MTVETMARAHWWSRNSKGLIAVHASLLEGESVPEIEHAWETAKALEIQAMQTALGCVTPRDVIS